MGRASALPLAALLVVLCRASVATDAAAACPAATQRRIYQDSDVFAQPQLNDGSEADEVSMLQTQRVEAPAPRVSVVAAVEAATHSRAADIGKPACPCIGIDYPNGELMVPVNGTSDPVAYPSNMGATCEAWDSGRNPACTGSAPPSWCSQPWCFVDACACDLSGAPPKTSSYLPGAEFQGRPVYYSYATCGGADTWTEQNHATACVNQMSSAGCGAMKKCAWTLDKGCVGKELAGALCDVPSQNDQQVWGRGSCPCIGISNVSGSLDVSGFGATSIAYPADMGSTCEAWDAHRNPKCSGKGPLPEWCSQSWCYVDPCNCALDVPPKTITYLPGATFQGHPIYYSYATCGNKDTYTKTQHLTACVNQKSQSECEGQGAKCQWTFVSNERGMECLGKELATFCAAGSGGAARTASRSASSLALLAAALAGVGLRAAGGRC